MPWQQHVLDVAYEVDDDGSLYYAEVDLTVGRQEGKTAILAPVATHRLTAMARLHGKQTLTYTAQHRGKARKKLEREFAELLRNSRSFREITNPKARPVKGTDWKISLNNGAEHIRIGRSYWQIDAPSRTGTHGDTLDLGLMDEAFAHRDDSVELAMTPAMATRADPQLWVVSAAGDATSYYLWRKIVAGRAAHESGHHGRVASFEWSAPDDLDPGDPRTWRLAMPALGLTIPEAFVAGKWAAAQRGGQKGIDSFRRSYLCQWPEIPILHDDTDKLFEPGVWEAVCKTKVAQPEHGLVFAVDVHPERTSASIAVASAGGSCALHARRPGVGWVVDELIALTRATDATVAVSSTGPAGSLIVDLERAGVTVHPVTAGENAKACGWFYDAVVGTKVGDVTVRRVVVQRSTDLDVAVAVASKKKSGDAFVWDRGAADITAFVALTQAAYVAQSTEDETEPNIW